MNSEIKFYNKMNSSYSMSSENQGKNGIVEGGKEGKTSVLTNVLKQIDENRENREDSDDVLDLRRKNRKGSACLGFTLAVHECKTN